MKPSKRLNQFDFSKSHFVVIFQTALLLVSLLVGPATISQAETSPSKQLQMLKMLDQLDQLDSMDLEDALSRAQDCIYSRSYGCAKKQLKRAKRYAHNAADRQRIDNGWRDLRAEQRREEQEEEELIALEEELDRLRDEQEKAKRHYARKIQEQPSSSGLTGMDVYNRIMQSGLEMRQQLQQIDRDTNAAIRHANDVLATQQRQLDAKQRHQQLSYSQQVQQQAYKQQQRVQQRTEELKQHRRERQQDLKRDRQERADQLKRKREQDKEARLARQRREKEEEIERYNRFYSAMKNGARLGAKNCGGTVVTGSLPSKSGYGVFSTLTNVHFRASCPGGHPSVTGVLSNMTGINTGCYGDTAKIDLPCKPEQISVQVTKVVGD